MSKPSAPPAAPKASPDTVRFHLQKKTVRPILQALLGLQQRTDMSGKFAKKLGRQRRALQKADEEIQEQRKDLVVHHAEKYPEGHEKAGQPTPVFATDPMGKPLFKKDATGADTEERIVDSNQFNLIDRGAFIEDEKDLFDETIVVECPAFSTPADGVAELEAFKQIDGRIIDALIDLEEGAETTKAPSDNGIALVKDEPKAEPEAVESAAPVPAATPEPAPVLQESEATAP